MVNTSRASWLEKWLLNRIFAAIGPAPVRFVIAGGETAEPAGVTPVATVRFESAGALMKLAIDPELGFAEGYADGSIQVEGNLVALLEAVYRSMPAFPEQPWHVRLRSRWLSLRQDNNLRQSPSHIQHHYDLGNDFYKLWLDREMVYTCAYFPTPGATLEQAQLAKMDHVCRKVQIRPGETVVEAGCGWGALALHMAEHYGARVKAFNISREQILYGRQKAVERGLSDRVEFIEDDYRNVSGRFDVFMSVGMLEHVGANHYEELGRTIYRSIGDSGRGLLHFIGRNYRADFSRWIRKRIFPGAYVPTLREAMDVLEPFRFSVLDVENLRMHYAKTLEKWLERFEKSGEDISEMYGAWFRRAWRLYLAGSIAGFRTNTLQLFQVVFAGSKREPLLWTRAPLYHDTQAAESGSPWMHATS